jgi:GNAT superfamily N-acetyltransferase
VACAGADVVGFAAVGPAADPDMDDRDTELLVIAVAPAARGSGHGSRLLHAVADTAREDGSDVLVVWVARDHEPTRAFLQRAGMAPDSAWRDRGVDEAGHTLREVRLVTSLTEPEKD